MTCTMQYNYIECALSVTVLLYVMNINVSVALQC